MSFLRGWLSKIFSSDRRRAFRHRRDDLVAYFWTGGSSEPCRIRDISSSGLFLETYEQWYPGTLVRLVVQDTEKRSKAKRSDGDINTVGHAITVQTMVVRSQENEGVGLAFFFMEGHGRAKSAEELRVGATRREMQSFLEPYISGAEERKE
jgi:hypothetical protein